MMFHLFIDGEGVSNDTLCAEFSFNNTVINEAYIECHKPMRGNKLTLRRDGEIRLFEFRPIGKYSLYHIIISFRFWFLKRIWDKWCFNVGYPNFRKQNGCLEIYRVHQVNVNSFKRAWHSTHLSRKFFLQNKSTTSSVTDTL